MKNSYDVDAVLASQRGIISRRQLLQLGVSEPELQWRIRPSGPWQVLLPGVYATFTGRLTQDQWWQAALLYAGTTAALTGEPALALWRIRQQEKARIPVLIDHHRQRRSRERVSIFRTERMPWTRTISGLVVVAPVRATADACRLLRDLGDVRAVVTEALRSKKVHVDELAREVDEGQRRGSARLRRVLSEYSAGIRSVAEAEARDKLLRLPIPPPLFNVGLVGPDGTLLARPDAYWPDASLAFEVDSRRHHGDMEDWEDTQRRHARLSAHGVMVMHASPRRIRTEWPPLGREVVDAYHIGRTRPPANVHVVA
ncbi:MAG TPA: hypothetical protein VF053_20820 [Streptosporangiales bacterium]